MNTILEIFLELIFGIVIYKSKEQDYEKAQFQFDGVLLVLIGSGWMVIHCFSATNDL